MARVVVFLYGLLSYVFFLGVFLYAIGFVGNILVPKSIDTGATDTTGGMGLALLINAALLGLFAVQHTIMARPGFKAWMGTIMPRAAVRSTFVLSANIIFVLIFWFWRPIGGTVWEIQNTAGQMILHGLFWLGWGIVLLSTFLIDHFELFGMRQSVRYLLGKDPDYPRFQVRSLYKLVRHPLMLGFLIAFWATPTMTVGHLFFSLLTTGYILVGLWFEERDLIAMHGAKYLEYSRQVPRLIPFTKPRRSDSRPSPQPEDEPVAP